MTAANHPPEGQAMPPAIWAFLFGNFVIGSGVMIVPGTLNDISVSLAVSVPVAGQLISAAALVMCLGAPLLASVVAGWDRRRLLALSMAWYGVLHLLSALMPAYGPLLLVRMFAVLAPAVFTPQAASCVSQLVAPSQRGRAITLVFLGWSVASVVGMPMGSWIGGTWGWQSAFATVGVLALGSALWIWRVTPNGIRPPAFSREAWLQTLRSRPLMLCVLVTALYSAGQFVLFSYFAPYYKQTLDMTPGQLSLMFAWFGAFGFLGNLLVSQRIDRLGAPRAVFLAIASMALSLAVWPLGSNIALAGLVIVPWALGCFASNSAQQARLFGISPALASGSIALNSSAMYAGQAMGAASGGWLIAHGQMANLHWAGLASLLLALLLSWLASMAQQRASMTP
jgi:predicted MFS family arabinose efflux permease